MMLIWGFAFQLPPTTSPRSRWPEMVTALHFGSPPQASALHMAIAVTPPEAAAASPLPKEQERSAAWSTGNSTEDKPKGVDLMAVGKFLTCTARWPAAVRNMPRGLASVRVAPGSFQDLMLTPTSLLLSLPTPCRGRGFCLPSFSASICLNSYVLCSCQRDPVKT